MIPLQGAISGDTLVDVQSVQDDQDRDLYDRIYRRRPP